MSGILNLGGLRSRLDQRQVFVHGLHLALHDLDKAHRFSGCSECKNHLA